MSNPSAPLWTPALPEAPERHFCTDCGLSRTANPKRCGQACQFIHPDYPALEARVHGRSRRLPRPGEAGKDRDDELFFGPHRQMLQASLKRPLAGAQWTGITTRIAQKLLEAGEVDALFARLMTDHYDPCYARSSNAKRPTVHTLALADLDETTLREGERQLLKA